MTYRWAKRNAGNRSLQLGDDPTASMPPSPERVDEDRDHEMVEGERRDLEQRQAFCESVDLERDVDQPGRRAEPFRPFAIVPETIAFGDAHRRIDRGTDREEP